MKLFLSIFSCLIIFLAGIIIGIKLRKKEKLLAEITIIYDDVTGETYSSLHFLSEDVPKDGRYCMVVKSKHVAKNTSSNMVS